VKAAVGRMKETRSTRTRTRQDAVACSEACKCPGNTSENLCPGRGWAPSGNRSSLQRARWPGTRSPLGAARLQSACAATAAFSQIHPIGCVSAAFRQPATETHAHHCTLLDDRLAGIFHSHVPSTASHPAPSEHHAAPTSPSNTTSFRV
jgi:hypothetical protein